MGTPISLNAVSYTVPALAEDNWGTDVSNYLIALSSGVLAKTGGSFTLTAEVDFGATYGLKSTYFKSRTTNPASAGSVRLAKTDAIKWRNNANGGDLTLAIDTSDNLTFGGNTIPTLAYGAADTVLQMNGAGTAYEFALINNANVSASAAIDFSKLGALTSAHILVGNGSNVATDVAVSGDIAIDNAGVTSIASGVIVNADVNASAAIAFSKLAALTSAHILVGNGINVATDVAVSGDIAIDNAGVTSIASGVIVNADVNASAAIAYSKLNLSGSVVNADVNASAAIAYSKLNLSGSVVNADVSASAAIAFSKLASLTAAHILLGSSGNVATDTAVTGDIAIDSSGVTSISSGVIVNADVNASAAIARSKLGTGTANHVVINDGSTGAFSSEATLAKSRGGSGQDNSSLTFPSSGTLATLAGTEALTNKDFDGGTASNSSRVTLPKAATATLSGLTRKQATLLYDSTTDQVKFDNGSSLTALATVSATGTQYSAKSSDYTVLDNDNIGTIAMTTGGTDRTITLPTAADNTHRILDILKVDGLDSDGTGALLVDGEGAETVGGASGISLYSAGDRMRIQCTGTAWIVIGLVQTEYLSNDGDGTAGTGNADDTTHFLYGTTGVKFPGGSFSGGHVRRFRCLSAPTTNSVFTIEVDPGSNDVWQTLTYDVITSPGGAYISNYNAQNNCGIGRIERISSTDFDVNLGRYASIVGGNQNWSGSTDDAKWRVKKQRII